MRLARWERGDQLGLEVVGGERTVEVESLRLEAAHGQQGFRLRFRLDSISDDGEVERLCDVHDGPYERGVVGVIREPGNE